LSNNTSLESAVKSKSFLSFDPSRVPSPCFVVDEVALENNLKILNQIQRASGAKILLALKAFSMFSLAPLINKYLSGVCASGVNEATLGKEEFSGEVHTFCAAFSKTDFDEVLALSDHIVFNSFSQWNCFQASAKAYLKHNPHLSFGLRINPMHSEGATPIYDPCAPGSRLGIRAQEFEEQSLEGISGLHFHTLCGQGFEPLSRTLDKIEHAFGSYLHKMKWLNFGGGHHITDGQYDIDSLINTIIYFKKKYGLQIYLEPGEAIAINTGILVSEVLDIKQNHYDLAILDTSATCHMPDTLEMPYKANILHASIDNSLPYSYRLGGQTCLAGDVMGDYSFEKPLKIGTRLMFDDMSHYTMVKTSTFNGIPLPSIAIWNSETNDLRLVKQFSYEDFKSRLS